MVTQCSHTFFTEEKKGNELVCQNGTAKFAPTGTVDQGRSPLGGLEYSCPNISVLNIPVGIIKSTLENGPN